VLYLLDRSEEVVKTDDPRLEQAHKEMTERIAK
jgi:hypothetical protein